MIDIIWNISMNTIVITAFVAMMMLTVEFINVSTQGLFTQKLLRGRIKPYLVAAGLGVLPGCLGAFAMVSLFAHRRVTVGAIVTTMIATSGDEAFIMLAMFPHTAILVFALCGAIGIVAGWITDAAMRKNDKSARPLECDFDTHPEIETPVLALTQIRQQWRSPSAIRGLLTGAIVVIILLLMGLKLHLHDHEHHVSSHDTTAETVTASSSETTDYHTDHDSDAARHSAHREHANPHNGHLHIHGLEGFMFYTLLFVLLLGLGIVASVSDHFLEAHLWHHVLKVHVPSIFCWILGALSIMAIIDPFLDLRHVVDNNRYLVLLIAIAIGMIPESGPHLVFVTLFAQGIVPPSILIASSISQDGHGAVPLLAHSRKDFFFVKSINAVVALAIGLPLMLTGL